MPPRSLHLNMHPVPHALLFQIPSAGPMPNPAHGTNALVVVPTQYEALGRGDFEFRVRSPIENGTAGQSVPPPRRIVARGER